MKKQLLLITVVLSFASPALAGEVDRAIADAATPVVGETPSSQVDHRGTQCKYAKAITSAQEGLIENAAAQSSPTRVNSAR